MFEIILNSGIMIILSISQNVLLFLSGFGILQAIFLAALLTFHPKSDTSVNSLLALYIVALSLPIILPVAQHIFSWQLMILLEPLLTLIAPLLYLYVRSFKEVITWKKAWPHFILFFICIPLAYSNYLAIGSKYPPAEQVPLDAARHLLLFLPTGIRLIQRITYYFLSRRALTSYQHSIQHLFSDTSRINLIWVRWLINGFLVLVLMTIVFYPLMIKFPQYFDLLVLVQGAIVSVYIYMAAFRGITQTTLWQMQTDKNKEKIEKEIIEAEKIESSLKQEKESQPVAKSLAEAKMSEILSRIILLMERDKLYTEPELTLQALSDKLEVPSYQTSQAINEGMKKNFYDLVNGYRVEEAKRLLIDPKSKNYTILSIGFEAGFNSKTTFNTVFKRFTGFTPTEFRNKQKETYLSV
jgi:AraC-like DNA-binding protein